MIINSFNLVHICVLLLQVVLMFVVYFIFRNKSRNAKRYFVMGVSVFNMLFFIVYKYWLYADPEFDFHFFEELPLQLCNINIILLFIAALKDYKPLYGFVFFVASVGALFALIVPEKEFLGMSIFATRNIGFYGTHGIILVMSISVMTLGLYEPTIKSLPKIFLLIFIISFSVYLINVLFRVTGLSPESNYFYTHGLDNPILGLFRKWIPIDYLYLMPCMVILGGWCFFWIGMYNLFTKVLFKKKEIN